MFLIVCFFVDEFVEIVSVVFLIQMVWEQSCELIIMLTEVVENGKVCCIVTCNVNVQVYFSMHSH